MPGIVIMDSGGPNGEPTNHDRSQPANGVNGAAGDAPIKGPSEKGKMAAEGDGLDNRQNGAAATQPSETQADQSSRMNDLPDEILHITQGFVPLSLLFTRLTQTSHNSLQDKINELANMQLPVAAVNGIAAGSAAPDDNSMDNIKKKASLLQFAQDMHARWVKALVIAEWSRKSGKVSKLIDLKFHIDQQRMLYDVALDNMANLKRDLTYARMPPPDLKTALQVLATGQAPWLPDLQYIQPAPLTLTEQLKWINEINTLLSLRLNLEDFDKIPHAFRNYEIKSGRATFKVQGEFEVDLTIADEDFEKQFWFIDFRFAFSPAVSKLSEALKARLEGCVNNVLAEQGLVGAYDFLHDYTLTAKINEIKRQANKLARSSWTGTLAVEPLHRALAIQYWTQRAPPSAPKSWVLIAVNSGTKVDGQPDSRFPSRLVAKWYRNNKVVEGVEVPFDAESLSAENLLKTVVGLHISHLLTGIHEKLQLSPRYKKREAGIHLNVQGDNPSAYFIQTQVGYNGRISLLVEPTTGFFAIKPQSRFAVQYEHTLNHSKKPADDVASHGATCLENLRCALMEDTISRTGMCAGWILQKAPVTNDTLQTAIRYKGWTRTIWIRREGWSPQWSVAVLLGLGGDQWWIVEANPADGGRRVKTHAQLPFDRGHPELSDEYWNRLNLFATGMIAQIVDLRELHAQRIKAKQVPCIDPRLPDGIRVPSISLGLSALLCSILPGNSKNAQVFSGGKGSDWRSVPIRGSRRHAPNKCSWAYDKMTIHFRGIYPAPRRRSQPGEAEDEGLMLSESEAIIYVRQKKDLARFASLTEKLDKDVLWDGKAKQFRIQVQQPVGRSAFDAIRSRVKAIDRFVNLIESLDTVGSVPSGDSMTLSKVSFSYGDDDAKDKMWRVTLDLSKDDIDIEFDAGNPHLRVIDLATRLVNGEGGIGALMKWLPKSLSLATAIDKIASDWGKITAEGRGELDFSMKAMDWMSLRYTLPGATPTPESRTLLLELRVKVRRGEPWWQLWRRNPPLTANDPFADALQPIWTSQGPGWLGVKTGAAGKPPTGVVNLLQMVDQAVQGLVPGATKPAKAPSSPEVLVID